MSDAGDVGEHAAPRHEGGVDAQLDGVAEVAADGEVLDDVAEALGEAVVGLVDAADALGGDRAAVIDPGAEGQHGQHHQLVGGVVAVDVERGIGLGVALRLGLGDGGVEALPALAHAGEHVVAGAVDDGRPGSRTQSLAKASRSVRMMGMPPPTAPSKARSTRLLDGELDQRAARGWASSILLAVTTPLPLRDGALDERPAGSSPPITSTTRSMAGIVDHVVGEVVSRRRSHSGTRSLSRSRTRTRRTSRGTPTRSPK